jgi:hypothetical protein
VSDAIDDALRQLLTEPPLRNAEDSQFVARVASRITRRRLFRRAAWVCGAAVLSAVTLVLSPILVEASTYLALAPVRLAEYLVSSQLGEIASMATGVGVLGSIVVGALDWS